MSHPADATGPASGALQPPVSGDAPRPQVPGDAAQTAAVFPSTPAAPRAAATAQPPAPVAEASSGPAFGHEFFSPTSAVWWLFCAALAVGTPAISLLVADSFNGAKVSLWAIAPLFVLTFVVFVFVVLRADPYRARRPCVLMLATAFGATVPTWLAMHANNHLFALSAKLLPEGKGADWGAAIAGPTSEEWAKMLGVVIIMLVASRTLRRPMHGLLVGAFVGLGFQIFENVSYAANSAFSDANSDLSGALSVTLLRSIIGISSHWLYTGITGVGVAYLLGRSVRRVSMARRVLTFVGLFALGWGLHFLWNSPVPEGFDGPAIPLKIAVSVTAFLLVARHAWAQERHYLASARDALAAEGFVAFDDVVASAAGTRKERKQGLKTARQVGGRAEKKRIKKVRQGYLDHLQAWGRRGTGVDEVVTH